MIRCFICSVAVVKVGLIFGFGGVGVVFVVIWFKENVSCFLDVEIDKVGEIVAVEQIFNCGLIVRTTAVVVCGGRGGGRGGGVGAGTAVWSLLSRSILLGRWLGLNWG